MRFRSRALPWAVVCPLALLATVHAQPPDEGAMFARIKEEGLQRSTAPSLFATLTDEIGPRLTGSPGHKRAAEWARDRLDAIGLANAHLEPWKFGRGWALDRLVVEMVEPRYIPLIGYAEAWSPATTGEVVAAPVFIGDKSPDEIAGLRDRLKGAIVMTAPQATFLREDRPQPTTSEAPVRIGAPRNPGPRRSRDEARAIAQTLREAGAAVLVRTSAGEHGTVFVLGRDQREGAAPSIVLAGEHYNLIARMLARGLPVKLRVNVQAHFVTDDLNTYNVVAELPGTDPALTDQVVMIGAHLDSWHSAQGASDNADGVASAIEALRILKAVDARPRRTIRLALWSGEEEGLLGSKAYVQQHLEGEANRAARDRLFVYFNLDPGTGPIYGWYLEETPAIAPLFDRWLEPLKAIGARRNVLQGIGSTDHLSFRAAGIPGFNPIQDYTNYDTHTHHTNVDTFERVRPDDLKESAVVLAWFAWQAANTDQAIPRP